MKQFYMVPENLDSLTLSLLLYMSLGVVIVEHMLRSSNRCARGRWGVGLKVSLVLYIQHVAVV
jgi:hypothetical protein